MKALFLSDVHVSPARPGAASTLCELLDAAQSWASDVYVLGDLFDQWLGDDDETPIFADVERAMTALTTSGVNLFVQHGNHDFLVGTEFASRTRATLFGDVAKVTLGDTRTLLMHGDSLCTDDASYLEYRAWSRDATNQAWFLGLKLAERAAFADKLRHETAELKELKPDDIMDVNADAVVDVLTEHNAQLLIHGHTHRPAVHTLQLASGPASRIVLGDWYNVGTVALHDSGGTALFSVPEALEKMANSA